MMHDTWQLIIDASLLSMMTYDSWLISDDEAR